MLRVIPLTGAFPGGLHPKHLGAIGRDQFRGEMIVNIAKRLAFWRVLLAPGKLGTV
jgi:hypothetical protein